MRTAHILKGRIALLLAGTAVVPAKALSHSPRKGVLVVASLVFAMAAYVRTWSRTPLLASLLRVNALCGAKLRGLSFVAALAAATIVFAVSPIFAQSCSSGTGSQLLTAACQSATAAGSNFVVGIGVGANASGGPGGGQNAAFGTNSNASGNFSSNTAIGGGPAATGANTGAIASGDNASNTALGNAANASGSNPAVATFNTAVGSFASATGNGSRNVAMGTLANANGDASRNVAIGGGANASGAGTLNTAVGAASVATGSFSAAFGANASATFANSSAFGAGASATAANQMAFGTVSNTYRMPGITSAASLAAQSGPTEFVTTDANGNLAVSSFSPQTINQLSSNVTVLQQTLQQEILLEQADMHRAFEGTAIAIAMGGSALPDNKRFALTTNWGNFRGTNAMSLVAQARVSDNIVANAGFASGFQYGGIGSRAGLTFAW